MDKISRVRLWGDDLNIAANNLIIIGGAEDKEKGKEVLRYICSKINKEEDTLVVATVATEKPRAAKARYEKVFSSLGVKKIKILDINNREDAYKEENVNLIREASMIFFTGGDQLRITSILGGTPIYDEIIEAGNRQCYFVGTSAGASVMSGTMIIGGIDEQSPRKCTIEMAPGLGLINNVIIDQHFSQRGRIGRLLAAVAQNPEILGIGIDEDTAIHVNTEGILRVIGNGAVYVVDGTEMTYSNVSEQHSDEILSMYNVKMHVLTRENLFDLKRKVPFEEENIKNENHR